MLQQGHATEDPVAAEEGRVMTADSAVAPDDRAVVDPDRHVPAEPAAVGPEDPWAWTDKSPTAAPASTRWGYSWGQALIILAGVASLVFGIGAVALAGLAGSVTAPVVQVFTYSHTPLLGLIEIGAGLAVGADRSRPRRAMGRRADRRGCHRRRGAHCRRAGLDPEKPGRRAALGLDRDRHRFRRLSRGHGADAETRPSRPADCGVATRSPPTNTYVHRSAMTCYSCRSAGSGDGRQGPLRVHRTRRHDHLQPARGAERHQPWVALCAFNCVVGQFTQPLDPPCMRHVWRSANPSPSGRSRPHRPHSGSCEASPRRLAVV